IVKHPKSSKTSNSKDKVVVLPTLALPKITPLKEEVNHQPSSSKSLQATPKAFGISQQPQAQTTCLPTTSHQAQCNPAIESPNRFVELCNENNPINDSVVAINEDDQALASLSDELVLNELVASKKEKKK
ncbi:unnamed protein product, partial [Ilex paraguariensis]